MRSIHVRIGHDNHCVVTQLGDIELFGTNTAAQSGNQCTDLSTGEHLIEAGFLYVEDLTLEWKNRLRATIPALLGRTPCRISLH